MEEDNDYNEQEEKTVDEFVDTDTVIPEDDTLSTIDEERAEIVDEIPVDDLIDTGTVIPEDDTLSTIDEERAEIVDEIPIDDLIDTGTVIPEGDTLSEVDEDRKKQDIIDLIIASGSDDDGADPSMEIIPEPIDDEEEPNTYIDEEDKALVESKLREDERIEQMNDEDKESETIPDIISNLIINGGYNR